MAGHSKWANIKRRKGAVDAKRGKVFTKLVREVFTAARLGGADPDGNPRLRAAIVSAKASSMPVANIERAIAKATGGTEGAGFEEITYEGYGPAGVAILVEAQTDNRNRTISVVRSTFSKNDGSLGAPGSVAWIFKKRGVFTFENGTELEEELMEVGIDAGAEDLVVEDGIATVTSEASSFFELFSAYEAAKLSPVSAELAQIPDTVTEVAGEDAENLLKLIEKLEDLDDIQKVYANFDISDEEMERLSE